MFVKISNTNIMDISIITSVIKIIEFVKQLFINKKMETIPKLTIEIINESGLTKIPRGNIDMHISNYKLIIRNNSDYNVYFPKMEFFNTSKSFFTEIDNLNESINISNKNELELKAKFKRKQTRIISNRMVANGVPEELENLKILVTYQDTYNKEFYTLFNFTTNKNTFHNKRPKEFEKNIFGSIGYNFKLHTATAY